MAFVNLSGVLTNSIGGVDVGATLKMTHLSTTGDTLSSTVTELIIPPNGAYDIDLNFGIVRFDYTTEFTQVFLAITTINGDTTATTIAELLNSVVPPTDAQLLLFQDILADAQTAETNAAASAVASAASAALSVPALTLALAVASLIVQDGDYVDISDRDMARFQYLTGQTPNGSSIVAADAPGLDLVIVKKREMSLESFGVVADGSTQKLAPVINYMNDNDVSVYGTATLANPVIFDDSFNLKNNRFFSYDKLHIKYVGSITDHSAVIEMGENNYSTYGPARFASAKEYFVGEVIVFSTGGWGDVMFIMGDYVYFRWVDDSGAETFPTSGTATGQTSGEVETITDSRPFVFPSANYHATLENIFLGTILDDGVSHVQATAVYALGVHGARWMGGTEDLVIQGFYNGFVAAHGWFMNFKGQLTTNRCVYGVNLAEDMNDIQINTVTSSNGTPYDSIQRRTFRCSYSYSINAFCDMESSKGASFSEFIGCRGWVVTGGDIETNKNIHEWRPGGSPALAFVSDPNTLENENIWSIGGTISGIRTNNTLVCAPQPYQRGLCLQNWSCEFSAGSLIIAVNSILSLGGANNLFDLRVKSINSNALDFKTGFEDQHTLSDNVVFTSDCYEYLEHSASIFIPASKTSSNLSRAYSASDISIEWLSISVGNEVGDADLSVNIFDFDGGFHAWDNIALTGATVSPTFGTFYSETFSGGKYADTSGARIRLTSLDTSDNVYNYTIRLRKLDI